MAKNIGILLNPDTGDLQVDARRDALGFIVQGLEVGVVTYQHQAIILQATRGELKEYPTLGVGIASMTNDHETEEWQREIILQLKSDGMRVGSIEIDTKNNKLTVDAEYNS